MAPLAWRGRAGAVVASEGSGGTSARQGARRTATQRRIRGTGAPANSSNGRSTSYALEEREGEGFFREDGAERKRRKKREGEGDGHVTWGLMMLAGGAGIEGRRRNADVGEAGAGLAGCLALGRRTGAAQLALKVRTSEVVVLLHRSRGCRGSRGRQRGMPGHEAAALGQMGGAGNEAGPAGC